MRNDARPIGHDQPPIPEPPDVEGSTPHDRQSDVVNREAEQKVRREQADADPVMPDGDSSLRTNI